MIAAELTQDEEQEQAREALRAAIRRSGLSQTRYARDVLLRSRRTVGRWLSGHTRIPQAVMEFLEPDRLP